MSVKSSLSAFALAAATFAAPAFANPGWHYGDPDHPNVSIIFSPPGSSKHLFEPYRPNRPQLYGRRIIKHEYHYHDYIPRGECAKVTVFDRHDFIVVKNKLVCNGRAYPQ